LAAVGNIVKIGVALIIVAVPFEALAAIGDLTGTSSPTVVVPQTTPAPQTPAYPTPPIGAYGGWAIAPHVSRAWRSHPTAPRVVAPTIPAIRH
jgi:hypothetical protein